MSDSIHVRRYTSSDAQPTLSVFIEAITVTAAEHYNAEQVEAWAWPQGRDLLTWHERRSGRATLVATIDDEVAGFSDVDIEGYIDMLFVAPRFARQGVATLLLQEAEATARRVGAVTLSVNASLVLRGLLERLGFTVEAEQHPEMHGIALTNYRMTKPLASEQTELH